MALKNQIENVPAASMGVRNDVDPFHTPEGALQTGRNVINVDGSLRPRPAHTDMEIVDSIYFKDPVEDTEDLTSALIHLTGADIVMSGRIVRTNDLSIDIVNVLFGANYLQRLTNRYDCMWATTTRVDIETFVDPDSSEVNAYFTMFPLITNVAGFKLIGDYVFYTSGLFSEPKTISCWPFVRGGDNISVSNETIFNGIALAGGESLIVVKGVGYVYTQSGKVATLPVRWLTETVVQNSTFVTTISGDTLQMFVDPSGKGILCYRWQFINGDLVVTQRSLIEGSFVVEEIHSAPAPNGDEFVVWHESSSLLFHTVNSGISFSTGYDYSTFDSVLGCNNSLVYFLAEPLDIWYVERSLSWSEPMAMYQFDADMDDKMIVAAIDQDLYRLNQGELTQICDLGGTMQPDVQVSRGARPVFRTFETGGKTWLVWTDINHGVTGWETDAIRPSISAEGTTGGVGLMVLANRLLRLGGAGDEKISVDVSAFNDWKDGWGTVQVSLLGDTPGAITGGTEISALQGAIFKEDAILHAIAQVEFGGVAAPFRFEQIVAGINGPPNQHCILQTTEGYSMFMGRDGGVYVYDGSRVHDLGRHVRNLVEGKLDFMYLEEIWGVYDPVRNLAFFMFPSIGSQELNRGVVVDAASMSAWEIVLPDGMEMTCGAHVIYENELTIGEVGIQFGDGRRITLGDFDAEERMVMCGFGDGRWGKQLWYPEEGNNYTDMGSAIEFEWETGAIPFGDLAHQFKTVHEGFHTFNRLEEPMSIQVNRYDKNMIKRDGVARTVSPGDFKTSHRETGRMFTVKGFGTVTRIFEYVMSSFANRLRGQR